MHVTLDEELCEDVGHQDLLLHYVGSAQATIQSVDQLGNFLMGVGVLTLGYLMHVDLSQVGAAFGVAPTHHQVVSLLTLGSWGTSVGLLVCFVLTYVFRVIAGRSVHAHEGSEKQVGEVIAGAECPDFEAFMHGQRTFGDFIRRSYRFEDQDRPEALLYARWSYMRFMTLRKLAEMRRMRQLLGLALLFAVAFKVFLVYQEALVA